MKRKSKKVSKVSFFSQKNPTKVNFLSPKFPSYLTSHTKPQNLRKYVANKKRLNRMDQRSFNAWGEPISIPRKDMTWPQAKVRFPKLNPRGDDDRDGVINLLDCRPFNRKRQGFEHQYSFSLTDNPNIRTVKMSPDRYLQKVWEQGGKTSVYRKPKERARVISLEEYKGNVKKYDRATIDYLKRKIKSKKEKVAIGFLTMRDRLVAGQEGRHTALAAEELNIKKIPVTIETADEKDVKGYEEVRPTLQVRYSQMKKGEEYDKEYHPEKVEAKKEEKRAEGLKQFDEPQEKDLFEKGEEGTLTPEDIEEHELKNFKKDYDLKDEDDQTLDYKEEEEK